MSMRYLQMESTSDYNLLKYAIAESRRPSINWDVIPFMVVLA